MLQLIYEGQYLGVLGLFIALAMVITCHEFAHAFIAYKSGDPTAKWNGRMSLNPVVHFDLFGFLMLALVGFGWAKPVPVDSRNFRNYRRGMFWTSAAGVLTNIGMAFLCCPLFLLVVKYADVNSFFTEFALWVTYGLFAYNIVFAVFNILPIAPLDGFNVVVALSKRENGYIRFMRAYGFYILIAILLIGNIFPQFSLISYAAEYISWPIEAFWKLIIKI